MAITENEFKAFVKSLPTCEVLPESTISGQRRADYLLNGRSIVAELKCLENDTLWKVQNFIDELIKARGFLAYGTLSTNRIIENQPDKESLNRKIVQLVSASLESHFQKANSQINSTAREYKITPTIGLVILINNANITLNPDVVRFSVSHLLLKKKQDGRSRFPCIHGCLYLCESHELPGIKTGIAVNLPALKFVVTGGQPYDSLANYLDGFLVTWARYRGIPLFDLGGDAKILEGARPRQPEESQ